MNARAPRATSANDSGPPVLLSLGQLSRFLVVVTAAAGGIVFAEPAPVDALMMGLTVLLPIAGLVRITRTLVLHLALWLVVGVGAVISSAVSGDVAKSSFHTVISFYLYLSMFVIAAFVAADPRRHAGLILKGYLIGAMIAAGAALIGYFNFLPGAFELFTKFGRASGTFKDPNVFGPFLVPAILYCIHLVIERRPAIGLSALAAALVLSLAVLLSFSRGAWFNLAVAGLVFGYLTLVTTRAPGERARLVLLGGLAAIAVIGMIIAALQVEAVAKLMAERSQLTQGYDVGPEGRFGGQEKAFGLVLSNPLGIGATQFAAVHHHEDVHNVYISMMLNAGWLGGLAYIGAVALTLALGLVYALRVTPTRPYFLIAYAALIGNVAEGYVIDTDHWRHFYLLLALILGLMAGEQARREPR